MKKVKNESDNRMSPELQKAFDNILDTMTCGDGGIRFYNYMMMLKAIDVQVAEGDEAGKAILESVKRFSRLIDAAQNPKHIKGKK